MAVRDTFSYSARWDSVGLDCSNCRHFNGPDSWPDKLRVSRCSLHGVSLTIELAKNGYKEREWFCMQFSNDGTAFPKAVGEFESLRSSLSAGVLYGLYRNDGFLDEYAMSDLPGNV